ncbi:tyrosine-protein phosphatase [Gulosibacter molinativorax]|uniref:tyrosine-protein phosphatase n=1 Tax=Gulosibacter molinativorax TaxID=256821 RepID=UPI0004002E0B|nr:tyrosine-protein phosphatase [Gulosibacter molinativorax]QUY62615.1 Hypotetical protein [Gulosibacter molinativorax]
MGDARTVGEHTVEERRADKHWAGAFNARDLGGIEVAAGAIRPGVLFRSGKPEAWEPEGFREAAASGVRRIVDLRDPSEPGGAPADAGVAGIDYEFSPIEDPRSPRFQARFRPYMNHTSGYADFLDMFGDRVAGAVGEVFAGSPGALMCCSAGRDRTGIVVSVILLALGASDEELARQDELAVRAVNERHRGRTHPYESWQPREIVDEMVASRRASLLDFAASLDARAFLDHYGIGSKRLEAASEWLLDA